MVLAFEVPSGALVGRRESMPAPAPEAQHVARQPQAELPPEMSAGQQLGSMPPAARLEHKGPQGQLAVDVHSKHDENVLHDPIYSTGAPSDLAQDTTVAAAPVAAVLPGLKQGIDAGINASASGRPDTETSSPSTGHGNLSGSAAPFAPGDTSADLMSKQQPGQHNVQQYQQQAQYEVAEHQHRFTAAAADEHQQFRQQQQHQQQQHQQHYSIGLELLGEAAALGLQPHNGTAERSAVSGRVGGVFAPGGRNMDSMPAAMAAGRQPRMSHNQVMLESGLYAEPAAMPAVIVPKPEGVQCQVPGCHSNLNAAGVSTYFRRHRVCATHAKADQVPINGMAMRFCQQCGIMHPLTDFDGSRKSCRVQLDRHNLRRRCRRKTQMAKNGRKPESGSRGGGGSSMSPSAMGGGSPPRTSGMAGAGKRAAARAAAAAFAAAAESESGVTDETSRDREVEGSYPYTDADYGGDLYGLAMGAPGGFDPAAAAAATMPLGGGYYTQQPSSRKAMTKANSVSGMWPDGAAVAAAYPGMPPQPGAQQQEGQMMGNSNVYGAPGFSGMGGSSATGYVQQQNMMQGSYGYEAPQQQQQQQQMGWDGSSSAAPVADLQQTQWPMDNPTAASGGNVHAPADAHVAAAVAAGSASGGGAGGSNVGPLLNLQQLRLHIASAIAGGKGPGITSIRNLGFVQQLMVVDELATGLMTEISKATGNGSMDETAPASNAPAAAPGSGYSQQQHQNVSMSGAVPASTAKDRELSHCNGTATGLGMSGLVDAAASAAEAGPAQLMQLLSQLSNAAPETLSALGLGGGTVRQQALGAGRLGSPQAAAGARGGAGFQRESGEQLHQQYAPAVKRQRSESGAGEGTMQRASGMDANALLRQMMLFAGNASGQEYMPPVQYQQQAFAPNRGGNMPQGIDPAFAAAAAAMEEDAVQAALADGAGMMRGDGNSDAAAEASDKSSVLSAAAALLAGLGAAAGVNVDAANQDALALLTGNRNRAGAPAASPVLQGSRAAAAPTAAVLSASMADAAAGNGSRTARESCSQLSHMHAALLRSLTNGLQAASNADAGAAQGMGGNRPAAAVAASGPVGSGPASNGSEGQGRTAQLLTNLLQQLAGGKR